MKLYEIALSHQSALDNMAEIENLDPDVIKDTMEMIEGNFNDKAISVAAYFMNIETEIEAIKNAEKRMNARRKQKESQVTWMKEYLLENMQKTGISKIESPYLKISLRNNPVSVCITDESLIPDEFKVVVTETKIDKLKIKSCGGCEGVELKRNMSVVIA